MTKSAIRPLGKWYEKRFEQTQKVHVKYAAFMGIFSVSKRDVQQHDRKRYLELMEEVGQDVSLKLVIILNDVGVPFFIHFKIPLLLPTMIVKKIIYNK